jgi:broad specificity phosphatase PhoE
MWADSPHLVSFPKGESLAEVRERVSSAVLKLMQEHTEETIAIVSHKVVCKVLVCHLMGLDLSHFWKIEQDVCAINVFESRNNLLVASKINDTCHLHHLNHS